VVGEVVPEPTAECVWAHRELGEPCVDVALWLGRIGYHVLPDEIDTIAARHAQRRDASGSGSDDERCSRRDATDAEAAQPIADAYSRLTARW
jgi:hypothetical protein